MTYKLNITEHAADLLDHLLYHLLYRLKNKQAAKHLLDGIDSVYDRLQVNPYQFSKCQDVFLAKKGYREAIIPQMKYVIIFSVNIDTVYVAGIFHQLEDYQRKV